VHKQYLYPFPDKSSRQSLLNMGTSLVGSSDWYQDQWEEIDTLSQKPCLILWGTKDEFITTEYLQKWKNRLPNAMVREYECGHFVQEEETKKTIQEIEKLMEMSN
jgi:haloalkane dehalogenase